VETFGLLVVAALLPTAAGYGYLGVRRLYRAYAARRSSLPAGPPIERIHADLRRLHDLLDRTENASDIPAKNLRCQATRAAYLDALNAACRQLQVPVPTGHPVPRAEIYRAEADLRRLGLDVRPVG
jgi:hypothetical protein